MVAGLSLANKCQLLFGFAVVVILTVALSVPWIRTYALVREYQVEVARQLADAWLAGWIQLGTIERPGTPPSPLVELLAEDAPLPTLRMTLVYIDEIDVTDCPREAGAPIVSAMAGGGKRNRRY